MSFEKMVDGKLARRGLKGTRAGGGKEPNGGDVEVGRARMM